MKQVYINLKIIEIMWAYQRVHHRPQTMTACAAQRAKRQKAVVRAPEMRVRVRRRFALTSAAPRVLMALHSQYLSSSCTFAATHTRSIASMCLKHSMHVLHRLYINRCLELPIHHQTFLPLHHLSPSQWELWPALRQALTLACFLDSPEHLPCRCAFQLRLFGSLGIQWVLHRHS